MVKRKSGPRNWIQIRMPPPLTVTYCGVEEDKSNSEMSLQVRKFYTENECIFLSQKKCAKSLSSTFSLQVKVGGNFEDIDLTHFLGDKIGTKLKISSEIKPPFNTNLLEIESLTLIPAVAD